MKKVRIHSDGGCRGNPGPGGWAAVLQYGAHRREISGGEPATTNNRMELTAAIEALKALKEPCEVEFFTDSKYLRSGISGWLAGWKRNGWRTADKKPVKNSDLWRSLDAEAARHRVEWRWVRGHSGDAGNERCDRLANAEMDRVVEKYGRKGLQECLERFLREPEPAPATARLHEGLSDGRGSREASKPEGLCGSGRRIRAAAR